MTPQARDASVGLRGSVATLTSSLVIGLVGCGAWGRLILRDLQRLGVDVVVADPDQEARGLASAAGARAIVTSPRDLPTVDGIIVATSAVTHATVVRQVLPLDVPVLVEKPFTTSTRDATGLADAGGGRIFLGHVWRYHPGVELLGAVARSGELGAVVGVRSTRANWTSPRTDVDATWNLLPHDLTLAIEILGAIPEPVHASAEMHDGHVVGVWAQFGTHPWLVSECSNRYHDKRREVRVHCTEGVVVLRDPDSGYVEVVKGNRTSAVATVERRTHSGESALTRELAAFVSHAAGGPAPKSDVNEGLAVVRAVERVRALAGLPQ